MEYFNLFFIVILIFNVESLQNKNIVLILTDDQDIHLNSVVCIKNKISCTYLYRILKIKTVLGTYAECTTIDSERRGFI